MQRPTGFERADNGNWFNHDVWNFYADDGFGNLVRVSSWPSMNHSSLDSADDYGF